MLLSIYSGHTQSFSSSSSIALAFVWQRQRVLILYFCSSMLRVGKRQDYEEN